MIQASSLLRVELARRENVDSVAECQRLEDGWSEE